MQKSGVWAVAAFVAGSVTAGGLALANHDGNVIHACTSKPGNVRIVNSADECRTNEDDVQWGIQGPAGPAGSAGVTRVITSSAPSREVNVTQTAGLVVVGSLQLPAGKWLASSQLTLNGLQGRCVLRTASSFIDGRNASHRLVPGDVFPPQEVEFEGTMMLEGPVMLFDPSTVEVACDTVAAVPLRVAGPRITALLVDDLQIVPMP